MTPADLRNYAAYKKYYKADGKTLDLDRARADAKRLGSTVKP